MNLADAKAREAELEMYQADADRSFAEVITGSLSVIELAAEGGEPEFDPDDMRFHLQEIADAATGVRVWMDQHPEASPAEALEAARQERLEGYEESYGAERRELEAALGRTEPEAG
jgi:hypothetical protein